MKRLTLILVLLLPLVCAARQLRPLVWVLDAGHGGKDQGTSIRNVLEKDLTLNITNRVAALIRENRPGIKVILTRADDTFVPLEERCQIANRARADLFLSIHINFAEKNLLLSGTETFYANRRAAQDMVQASNLERNADNSELLAWLLQNSYYNSGRTADRGARANNLHVLMHTEMPAALTEVGFLSNVGDAAYMCSERGQRQIALDIYTALDAYYSVTKSKSQKKTLRTLRQSRGTVSGLKVKRVREVSSAEDLMPMQDPFAREERPAPAVQEESVQEEPATVAQADTPSPQADTPGTSASDAPTPEEASARSGNSTVTQAEATVTQAGDAATKPGGGEDERPLFSVQLFAVSKKPLPGDSRLKGLAPVKTVQAGSVYKVLYAPTADYQEARATLARIRDRFPDAFIVAYVGDRAVSTAQALQMVR